MDIRNEIKSYIVREGMTMTEIVEKLADEYGCGLRIYPSQHQGAERGSAVYRPA